MIHKFVVFVVSSFLPMPLVSFITFSFISPYFLLFFFFNEEKQNRKMIMKLDIHVFVLFIYFYSIFAIIINEIETKRI